MKEFKFFNDWIMPAHDGGYIRHSEFFYSMNKEEMESVTRPGEMIPKYTIVQRCIHPIYKDKFKPDHEKLWYFKSKQNAEYLRTLWMNEDMIQELGEIFHKQSDITITFNR